MGNSESGSLDTIVPNLVRLARGSNLILTNQTKAGRATDNEVLSTIFTLNDFGQLKTFYTSYPGLQDAFKDAGVVFPTEEIYVASFLYDYDESYGGKRATPIVNAIRKHCGKYETVPPQPQKAPAPTSVAINQDDLLKLSALYNEEQAVMLRIQADQERLTQIKVEVQSLITLNFCPGRGK